MSETEEKSIVWPHVFPQAIEISTMKEVKKSFEGDYDRNLNWLFVGVSPLYGLRLNLDQIEEILADESDYSDSINGRYFATILIIHPRIPVVKYGEIQVSLEDVEWLRGIVRNTLEAINESQERNI